ncbi:TglA family RiPP precursor [Dryocola sp. LX212]
MEPELKKEVMEETKEEASLLSPEMLFEEFDLDDIEVIESKVFA